MGMQTSTPTLEKLAVSLKLNRALAGVGQLFGASSCSLKGHRLHSQSGHIPSLSTYLPSSLSLKATKKMSSSEDK